MDVRKRMKMKTITEYIAGVYVWSMYTEFNLRHNVQFYRCVDIRKIIKTLVWVDMNRSMRFRWQHFWKRISVDRV